MKRGKRNQSTDRTNIKRNIDRFKFNYVSNDIKHNLNTQMKRQKLSKDQDQAKCCL